ncbi:MAG: 3-deoxy-manno-octulosonate cytidylyltransferase [Candidatus Edwardsbacteria bacterium]
MQIVGVIPARYNSTRFPGKPLAEILGKPMIQWVYERAKQSSFLERVIVATDDTRIYQIVREFKGEAAMTSPSHQSGTDRVAETVRNIDCQIVINIQGDEPLIEPAIINQLAQTMLNDDNLLMATLATRFSNRQELENPNTVKILIDKDNYALYFSRAIIPCFREKEEFNLGIFLKHIGIYAYRKDFLLNFTQWPPSLLEKVEKLEQLRAIENGVKIKVIRTDFDSLPIDLPEDLEKIKYQISKIKMTNQN